VLLPLSRPTDFLIGTASQIKCCHRGILSHAAPGFHPFITVPRAILQMNRTGLRAIMVSAQPGVARGFRMGADGESIHDTPQRLLSNQGVDGDAFFFPHMAKIPTIVSDQYPIASNPLR
jgi:hypothetical protein